MKNRLMTGRMLPNTNSMVVDVVIVVKTVT
jgi:hypothetical protein